MKNIITALFIVSLALTTGCSMEVVEPATKGKILTTQGYSPEILEPGKYTLWGRDQLITLDTSTATYSEKVKIVMADKLTLHAEVRFRGRLDGKPQVINAMFNDIKVENGHLAFSQVYGVYGRMAVRNKTREILSQYDVHDVHANYARLSGEIAEALVAELASTPLQISDVALGNIEYPAVVTAAIEAAAERDMAIAKEEAQAKIDLTKKENERLLAEADYQVRMTKAKATRDENKVIGEGISDALLKLKALEVQEAMAANGSAVFLPYEALGTTGAQVRMFNGKQ